MNIHIDPPMNQFQSASVPMQNHRSLNSALKVGHFLLHLLEMTVVMMVGMPILFMLRSLIPASSSYAAAFKSGTILFEFAMAIFMTVPMVAWMIGRGHGWRHSAEMGFAMFSPVALVILLRLLGADTYLPWLSQASHLGMFLGMLIAMLYRRDHYTGRANHSAHAAHQPESTERKMENVS